MINIYIKDIAGRLSKVNFDYKWFTGGEPHVMINRLNIKNRRIVIEYRTTQTKDMILLIALNHALKAAGSSYIDLVIPYFPGARQDRQEIGGVFTARMYADLINGCQFRTVHILDPHSYVTPGLINRCVVHSPMKMISKYVKDYNINGLISPDSGAYKRTIDVANECNIDDVVCATKSRNHATGNIYNYTIPKLYDLTNYLVIDDICDGGMTFNLLGQEFKNRNLNSSISLWVTHGIFSNGLDTLRKYYEFIFTTNSIPFNFTVRPHFITEELNIQEMINDGI